MTNVHLTVREGGTEIAIRVTPRGGRNAIDGATATGALRVRLAAPPVDGAANAALVEFLAAFFAVPKRSVTITYGHRGRDKRVLIAAPSSMIEARVRVANTHT